MKILAITILLSVVIIGYAIWREQREKKNKEEKEEREEREGKEKKSLIERHKAVFNTIRIMLGGAVFLVFFYLAAPDFVSRHHKEIGLLVAAMMANAIILGVKEREWDKNTRRKILSLHYLLFILGLGFAVFYNDPKTGKWIKGFEGEKAISADYPLCVDQKAYDFWSGKKQIRAKLYPNCWSGWVKLPPQVNFMVDTPKPGDLEYKFWDGKRILVLNGSSAWFGDIKHSSFRLRGNGEAIITIEKLGR